MPLHLKGEGVFMQVASGQSTEQLHTLLHPEGHKSYYANSSAFDDEFIDLRGFKHRANRIVRICVINTCDRNSMGSSVIIMSS
jgi:hypothetical protein